MNSTHQHSSQRIREKLFRKKLFVLYSQEASAKNFCHAQRILAVNSQGGGILSESIKKGKFETKMIPADVKANIKQQEIKYLVVVSYKLL